MKKQDKTAYVAPITEILCVKSEHVMQIAGSDPEQPGGEGGGGSDFDSKKGFFDDEDLPQMKYNMWEEDEEEESDSYFKTK